MTKGGYLMEYVLKDTDIFDTQKRAKFNQIITGDKANYVRD